jgi:hypothetical protein
MTKNYNTTLSKEMADVGKIQTSSDRLPSEFADKIIFVADVNPKHSRTTNIIKRSKLDNNTSTTIYTVPAAGTGQKFFLTGASLGLIKDATSTSTITRLNFTAIDGSACQLLEIPGLSLTAQSEMVSMSFPHPIEILPNSGITLTNSAAAANISASAVIMGYIVDNANA